MIYKPTEYCKVCKNYQSDIGHCRKGWENSFCEGDDFNPSLKYAVLNFLSELQGKIQEDVLVEIRDYVWEIKEGD